MKKVILISFIFYSSIVSSQKINIALFFEKSINSIVFTTNQGSYILIADSNYLKLHQSDLLHISFLRDSILIKTLTDSLGLFARIEIKGIDKNNSFILNPNNKELSTRIYDDNLTIIPKFRKLLLINNLNIEKYIAGVVEAEGGPKAHIEYYKSQAIMCRTYMFQNIDKHSFEGFNLCDEVHCQAYKGKTSKNIDIVDATFQTARLVITDTANQLVTAAFHSNCGGQTEDAGNVWLQSRHYLVSKKDTFCLNQRNSNWEVRMPSQKWKVYLEKYGAKIPDNYDLNSFIWNQNERKKFYTYQNIKIPVKDIRYDFKLRSAFFSISIIDDNVVLKGKGYGHGVGLCQEGAMKMALLGKSYKEIIDFYFNKIQIIDYINNNSDHSIFME